MDEYTVTEAAAALGLTRNGVLKRIKRGDMAARRIGGRFLVIPAAEIERWKALGPQKPGPKRRYADEGKETR